jgi:hypothetical protein
MPQSTSPNGEGISPMGIGNSSNMPLFRILKRFHGLGVGQILGSSGCFFVENKIVDRRNVNFNSFDVYRH